MLTWNVTYHCKPGKREEFFKAISALGVRAHSNSEAGNVKYDYFFRRAEPRHPAAGGDVDRTCASAGALPDGDLRPASGAENRVL